MSQDNIKLKSSLSAVCLSCVFCSDNLPHRFKQSHVVLFAHFFVVGKVPCLANANGNPKKKTELDGSSRRKRPHYCFFNQASLFFWSSLVEGLKTDNRAESPALPLQQI